MSIIETHRNNVARKRQELAKLFLDRAKESGKIQPLKTKVLSVKSAISRTKQLSSIKSKGAEIDRYEKTLVAIDKKLLQSMGKLL